jgi:hypothetical protein
MQRLAETPNYYIYFLEKIMIIQDKPEIIRHDDGNFELISNNKLFSPCCQKKLLKFGQKERKFIDEDNFQRMILLQRYICSECRRTHLELPSFLFPYKRHCSDTIELCVETNEPSSCANCEPSTVYRIKKWFQSRIQAFLNCLSSRQSRFPLPGDQPVSSFEELPKEKGWLIRLVSDLINHGYWKSTQYALSLGRS